MKYREIGSHSIKIPYFLVWLFPYKEKKLNYLWSLAKKSKIAYLLIQNIFFLSFVNWLSQGLTEMIWSERVFHFFIDFISFIVFFYLLNLDLVMSLILAHTINWLFNSHFWTFIRFLRIPISNDSRNNKFLLFLRDNGFLWQHCLVGIFLVGGVSRKKSNIGFSDLDIKFVKKKGVLCWFMSNIILLALKVKAFLQIIPFDAYLYDNFNLFSEKVNAKETPIALWINKYYQITQDFNFIEFKDL